MFFVLPLLYDDRNFNINLQVELVNDNLFEWHVRLHQIDPESELAGDLRELHIPHILLHLIFPENFPFAPPFMRVIEPRIEKGFVMEGGLHLIDKRFSIAKICKIHQPKQNKRTVID